jgi:hypothetical protein
MVSFPGDETAPAYTARRGNRKCRAQKLPTPVGTLPYSSRTARRTFVMRGQQLRFDGAKDEDSVLLIVGVGPATSTPAEEK